MYNAGDFDTTETVHIPLNSFSSDDPTASVTMTNLAAGDIEIHKDGSATQRSSDSGVTVTIDFDSVTGNHMINIDLSDNTDAGFYSAGSRYLVRIEGVTVDGGTLNAWVGGFSIGCSLRPTTAGRTVDVESGGCVGVDWGNVANPTTAVDLSATDIQLCDTVSTLTGHTAQSGDNYTRLGAPAGASIAADIAANQADLDTLIAEDGSSYTSIPWNSAWDTEVQSECNDALVALRLDHLIAVAESDDPVDNSIIAKLAASDGDWSGFDNSTESLEAIRDRGDADWSSGAGSNPNMILEAEIATVASQTEFTLATGADFDDAYTDQVVVLYDDDNSDYPSVRVISNYVGATKTVTIESAPDFTLGTDDSVRIFATPPGSTVTEAGVAAEVVTILMATVIDTTRTFKQLMKNLMAFIIGNSTTQRTASGVTMTYLAEDNATTQMQASITEAGRTITEEASE